MMIKWSPACNEMKRVLFDSRNKLTLCKTFFLLQDLEAVEPKEAGDIEREMVEPKSTEEGHYSQILRFQHNKRKNLEPKNYQISL